MGLSEELGYHKLTLTLLKASWRRAQKLVAERRTTIVKVSAARWGFLPGALAALCSATRHAVSMLPTAH